MDSFTPYLVVEQHEMECHRGIDKNKQNNAKRRENLIPKHVSSRLTNNAFVAIR